MKINNYYKASTLEEAYEVLQEDKSNLIIGGGAWLKTSRKTIESVIDITKIGLTEIIAKKDYIEIGAMTSLRQIELSEDIKSLYDGILSEAISQIMGVNIRNIATIGGSVMGKYAFSDIFTPLLAMDASLIFYKQGVVKLEDFLETKRMDKDILTKIIIPNVKGKGYFYKVQKTRLDFAVLNVAITKTDKIEITVGARPGITKKPIQAIEYLNNSKFTDSEIIETARIAVDELHFSTNSRASEEYRKDLAQVYIRRGIEEVTK